MIQRNKDEEAISRQRGAHAPREQTRPERTVNAGLVQPVIAGIAAVGLAPRAMLARAGIDPCDLTDADRRIPLERYLRLWEIASACPVTGPLGLAVGSAYRIEHGGVVGYAMASSVTLGEALNRSRRYRRLVGDGLLPDVEVEGELVHFMLPVDPRVDGVESLVEGLVASWMTIARALTGHELRPQAVRFRHARRGALQPYLEAFGCPVLFEQRETRIAAPPALLDLPSLRADPQLCAYLDNLAEGLLERLPRDERLSARVRRLLAEGLCRGEPSQDRIARRLAMGARTLQRRLKEEGSSFNELLDEVRRELSERYLKERSLSIQQITSLLGYADPSAFRRALRRWTGRTPQELRSSADVALGLPSGADDDGSPAHRAHPRCFH